MRIDIDAKTSVYAILGYPVDHSLSPKFWNLAFDFLGLNAVYVPLAVFPENASNFFGGLRGSGISGANVTRPHKFIAAQFCQVLQGAAFDTKIVNTIKISTDQIVGWNTDATGFLNLLKKFGLPKDTALVLGDGASSISAIWALKKYGVKNIIQIARKFTEESLEELDSSGHIKKIPWISKKITNSIEESDIIINTTAIGWHENDQVPGFAKALGRSKTFVDFNYSKCSRVLADAGQYCGRVIEGRELLYEQGLEAFKLLTNLAPPAEVIRSSIFD